MLYIEFKNRQNYIYMRESLNNQDSFYIAYEKEMNQDFKCNFTEFFEDSNFPG